MKKQQEELLPVMHKKGEKQQKQRI
jgi:hypothetical protein